MTYSSFFNFFTAVKFTAVIFPVFLNGTPISAISVDDVEQFPHLGLLSGVEEH